MTDTVIPTLQARVIDAIDHLNSWVRSRSYAEIYGNGPKRKIYWMKQQCIERARALGLCRERAVKIVLPCRDCRGAGRYTNHDGYTFDHCRDCDSTGTVTLFFIETTIPTENPCVADLPGYVWHTPGTLFSVPNADVVDVTGGNWTTNLPGRDLSVMDACAYLLIAEAAFPRPMRTGMRRRHDDGAVEWDENLYQIYLGEPLRRACALCGRMAPEGLKVRQRAWRVSWSLRVCDVCCDLVGVDRSHLPVVPPFELTEHPTIREWIATNRRAQTVVSADDGPLVDPFADQ